MKGQPFGSHRLTSAHISGPNTRPANVLSLFTASSFGRCRPSTPEMISSLGHGIFLSLAFLFPRSHHLHKRTWSLTATSAVAGTDHPFFPPLEDEEESWLSVTTNYAAINKAFGDDKEKSMAVLGGNAVRLLKLEVE
jgi:hypothetical protein